MEDLASFLKETLSREEVTPYQLSRKTGISRDYLSRLLNGKIAQPGLEKLQKIAHVLNFELSDLPAPRESQIEKPSRLLTSKIASQPKPAESVFIPSSTVPQLHVQDAIPGAVFVPIMNIVGRSHELATLEQWIVNEQTKIVSLWGLAGIGKTTLASAIAQRQHNHFDQIHWLDVSLTSTRENLQQLDLYPNFLNTLQTQKVLLVLDHLDPLVSDSKCNVVSISTELEFLCQHVMNTSTNTCLLLLSRAKMPWLHLKKDIRSPAIHFLRLEGLKQDACQLLESQGLSHPEYWNDLIQLYRGHPLALKLAASVIQTIFGGFVLEFLKQETLFLGDLTHLLQEQMSHLSARDQELLRAIAGQLNPTNFINLYDFLPNHWRKSQLIDSLNTLITQSLVDVIQMENEVRYALQPLVKHFVLHYCLPKES
jgi:transcriptional regulator with XRE-family HTH domain